MSKKEGAFSVVGAGADNEPLSLGPRAKFGTAPAPAAAPTPVIRNLQQVSDAAPLVALPKKAVPGTKKTSMNKPKPTAKSTTTSAIAASAEDDDDEDEGDQEEIIPMKVPNSDTDDDDDADDQPAASPSKSTGPRDKTFLSEVDLLDLQPLSFEAAAKPQADRAAANAALAEAEALALASSSSFKPRVEWSTSSPDSTTPPTEVFCLAWSPDAKLLAAGCGDGTIRVFSTTTGKVAYTLKHTPTLSNTPATGNSALAIDESLPITCIRFRPSGGDAATAKTKNVLLASCADGTISHWHISSQTCLYQLREVQETSDAQVYALDYRPDGEQFASGGRDGRVRLYDESTKALSHVLSGGRDRAGSATSLGHSNRIYTVKYHTTDPNILVSGGWDSTIQIWDLRTGTAIRSFYGPHLCGDALDVARDGTTLLTGSWRPHETLQRWDFTTGKLLDTVPFALISGSNLGGDRPELLYAAAYSPDGRMFAAGGCGTNEARVFANTPPAAGSSPKGLERITLGQGGVYCLAFAPTSKKLAIGGGGPHVTIVDL